MKSRLSLISCWLVLIVLLAYRVGYSDLGGKGKPLVITRWDAFGYYQYLPATLLFHDYKKLAWVENIDARYKVTGGDGLPVQQLENGNKVCKYLCGVAILQAPLFGIGHLSAKILGYPADGFSAPYQYALAFGAILYCFLALLFLRRILRRYFPDAAVAWSILLLALATNFIQYAAVDNGLSHCWIFPLYVVLLWATIRWHEKPHVAFALLIGLIIGIAAICRPTEAIALFIPLLWGTQSKETGRRKWRLVREHWPHIAAMILGGLLGVLPQLLYWKSVTGSFVYDVGSKWLFFNPWFRVLIGWEKGWFIYTPVTILFVAGMMFIKRFPFRWPVVVFCLLNIWIVIAWEDWHYGASYSCRALVQSYPVFAFPLAASVERLQRQRWKALFYVAGVYLIGVNAFQVVQYNSTILHYDEMNRLYYGRIYLNPRPSPLDMSLLDTHEWLRDPAHYKAVTFLQRAVPLRLSFRGAIGPEIIDTSLRSALAGRMEWLKIEARIDAPEHLWQSRLVAELHAGDSVKRTAIRLFNPIGERTKEYACYMMVPEYFRTGRLVLRIESPAGFEGTVSNLRITGYCRHLRGFRTGSNELYRKLYHPVRVYGL